MSFAMSRSGRPVFESAIAAPRRPIPTSFPRRVDGGVGALRAAWRVGWMDGLTMGLVEVLGGGGRYGKGFSAGFRVGGAIVVLVRGGVVD